VAPQPGQHEPVPVPEPSHPSQVRDSNGDLPQTFFLGRYRVVDEIGIGGMASVHLARVDGPGGFQKWVAIKRIHPHLVEDDQFVDMFLDEARIAAGINHANVAQVFDLGKDETTYWIAMEYLHGEPLREVMRRTEEKSRNSPAPFLVPFHIAARICADAAEGLHGAHELRGRSGQLLNLVHRDVTPHNLFVTYDGYTKVVDFGIAKVVDRLASTRAGTLKGKLAYMSPEQVRGQEVDRKTDIFALGVVLWELTTNRRLFRMETDLDTLEKVQACVVPLPSTIVGGYPPELEAVVMKALSQRREDRFQTAREFSRALQRFLMTQGTFVGPEDVGDYVKELFTDRVRKREKYLEWAAEVTSAVDIDELRQQRQVGEQQAPSLLQPAADGAAGTGAGSAPSASHVQPRQQVQQSFGQNSASAAVVATVPQQAELASSSLMDEDEDIPTVVAQPALTLEASPGGMRPAAGAQPEWDGGATQLVPEEAPADQGLDSTIALPDAAAAEDIRARVEEMDQRQRAQQAQLAAAGHMAAPPPMPGVPAQPGYDPQAAALAHQHGQGQGGAIDPKMQAIETKMSLPRPAAVAQWLMEQGDVEIQGPRSTGVIVAIAALATLCVMGVASLIIYKLRLPSQGEMAVTASATSASAETARGDGDGDSSAPAKEASNGSSTSAEGSNSTKSGSSTASSKSGSSKSSSKSSPKPGSKGSKSTGSGSKGSRDSSPSSKEPPGTLTIISKPACDSVVAGGRSLGPCPVFGVSMPPGQHRVTLKRKGKSKTIMVRVQSGKSATHNVSMK
jgi:serine/threonine protein kinase